MGCFTESCGISHLTIGYGETAYLLPLVPAKYQDDNGTSYIQTTSLYKPLCLPIKGKYNDYGSLENIVETETTKRIEEYFGVPIQDFVDVICEPMVRRDLENFLHPDFVQDLKGMWIYGDIYDHYAIANQDIINNTFRSIEKHLEHVELNKKIGADSNTPDAWFPKPDIMIDFDRTALTLYYDLLIRKDKKVIDDLSKFYSVENTMYNVNAMFIPTFSGSQDGSEREELALHQFACEILKGKLKHYDE